MSTKEPTNEIFSVSQIISAPIELDNANDRCTQCETELKELQNQVSSYDKKVLNASKIYHETLVSNLKKDLKIKELKEKLMESPFDEFVGKLPSATIAQLNMHNGTAGNDSNFVLKAMRGVYGEDLSRLKNKTYSGRKKEALTPEKKEIINKLFMKRIDLYERDPENITVRKSCLGKYIKNAIESINNTV